MTEHDKLAEARVGSCPAEPPKPLWSAAEMADLVRQVRIDHAPQLEDDDQGPFLHCEDASVVAHACWPRIASALAAARAQGAAEAFERAAKACIEAEARYRADADEAAERDQPLNWSASDGCAITAERLAAAIRALAREAAK